MKNKLLLILFVLLSISVSSQTWNTGWHRPTTSTTLQTPNNPTFYINKSDTSFWSRLGSMGDIHLLDSAYVYKNFVPYRNGKDTLIIDWPIISTKLVGDTAQINNILVWEGDTIQKDSIAYLRILGDGDSIQFKRLDGTISPKYYYIPPTPADPNNKRLNGNRQWVPTEAAGSGGYNANLYFTTIDSDITGYKELSYIPEAAETELTATISNGEYLLREYLYPDSLNTSIIDAGEWFARFRYKVSRIIGVTQLKLEIFLYHSNGTTTTLFSTYSDELNSTDYETVDKTSGQPVFNVVNSDRLGVRLYGKTTSVLSVTINTIVGDGNGAYIRIPLKPRHSIALRDLEWLKAGHFYSGEGVASFGISGQAIVKPINDLTSVNNKITINGGTDVLLGTGTSLTLNEGNIIHQNLSGSGTNTHTQIDNFITSKGQPNGLASLLDNGKLPSSQIPSIAITQTFPVAVEGDKVLLNEAEMGDIAIVQSTSKSYILKEDPYSVESNWVYLSTPESPVISVNGEVGNVSLTTSHINEGTNLYYTDTRARSAISLTTTGSSGASTYSSGVFNIPQYQGAYTNLTNIGSLSNTAGFLKNNGSGTFSYTYPTFSEITNKPTTLSGYGITDAAPASGSANYIQNQNSAAQTANMWISGTGAFGSTIQATTAKFTNLTDGYIPYHVSDAGGLANSGIFWSNTYGRMGIGTTSPSTEAEIQRYETVNRTTYNDILTISALANTLPYTGHGGGILFRGSNYQNNNANINYARIGSTINSNSVNQYGSNLFFDVTPTSSGTLTRAMTIQYNGNVGIGTTTNINSKLTFAESTTAAGGILFGTDVNLYRSAANVLKTDDTFNIGTLTASKLVFTDANKNLTSTGFGTALQFLKADGSVDSNIYLTSFTETDPVYTASSWYSTANNSATWNSLVSSQWTSDTNGITYSSNIGVGAVSTSTNKIYVEGSRPFYSKATSVSGYAALLQAGGDGNTDYNTIMTNATGDNKQIFYASGNVWFRGGLLLENWQGSAPTGALRYYAAGNVPQYFNGTAWVSLSGGGSMIYPTGTGIPTVLSGSSWGTTLGTSGSGNVALVNSPSFTTPYLGVATSTGVAQQSQTLTSSSTPTFNYNNGANASIILTSDITSFTFSNVPDGGQGYIAIIQDGTGGWDFALSSCSASGLTIDIIAMGTINTLPYATANRRNILKYLRIGSVIYATFIYM